MYFRSAMAGDGVGVGRDKDVLRRMMIRTDSAKKVYWLWGQIRAESISLAPPQRRVKHRRCGDP